MQPPQAEVAYHEVLSHLIHLGQDDGEGNLEIINLAFEIEKEMGAISYDV